MSGRYKQMRQRFILLEIKKNKSVKINALAAQLARGENITAALTYASAFASLAVEREGASNMPEHSAVIERLHSLID